MRQHLATAVLALAGVYLVAVSLWLCLVSVVADMPAGEWIDDLSGWYAALRKLLRGPS